MPHCSLKYSAHFDDVDFKPLLAQIAQAFVSTCQAGMASTLGYTRRLDQVLVAGEDDPKHAIIWIRLKMKAGRTAEQKQAMMEATRQAVDALVMPYVEQQSLFCQPRIELSELSSEYSN